MSGDNGNSIAIEAEIAWFERALDLRFRIHGGEAAETDLLAALPPPPLAEGGPPYAEAVLGAGLGPAERLVLILALLPHLRPQALDPLLIPNSQSARPFTEFGGAPADGRSGFRPTRETALFLIAGESMEQRLGALPLFGPEAPLQALRILDLPAEGGEAGPWMPLAVARAWIERLTGGSRLAAAFGAEFPAQRLETAYEWDDLVLSEEAREEIGQIVGWVRNESALMEDWGLARHLKPGCRALFHGPPGTGKTVTAAVLGKSLGRPVYRVDLSRVVSKYIGETEKNLAALFDHAADGEMILFFDEADALFGKRGDTRTANDRHANQQIAYLLQRIEDSPGLVILASNLRDNIDAAFTRRFQVVVAFPMPDGSARETLWRRCFGLPNVPLEPDVDFAELAREHELSGGAIINVLRAACVRSLSESRPISRQDLRAAVWREVSKEGRWPA